MKTNGAALLFCISFRRALTLLLLGLVTPVFGTDLSAPCKGTARVGRRPFRVPAFYLVVTRITFSLFLFRRH